MILLTRRTPQPATDSVALSYDARKRSRLRLTLVSGREAGIFLERGEHLQGGDRLITEDGSTVVEILAAPEKLIEAVADSPLLFARAAYHLGNRHVPIELQPDHLKIEPDHVLADMLRAMHLIVTEQNMAFEPEGGAYAAGHGGGHSHGGHGHGDDHHHGHGQGHSHDHDHDHTHDHGHTHEHSHAAAPATAPARGRTVSIPVVAQGHVHGPGCNHAH